MRDYLRFCFLLLLAICTSGFAQSGDNDSYWQCTTYDAANQQWTEKNFYKKVALNVAFSACKKQSQFPASCKTGSGNCEQFNQGMSVKPLWECTALDSLAAPWRNNPDANREEAALAAKAYCKQHSAVPETCYVNLITCVAKREMVH